MLASQKKCLDKVGDNSNPDVDDRYSGKNWMTQWCGESMPEEFYFTMNGKTDMFFSYNNPFNETEIAARCKKVWNIKRENEKVALMYGSPQKFLDTSSRIIFSNGYFDPWSSGGVSKLTLKQKKNDLHSVVIPNGAHHVDLMFSTNGDTIDIKLARKFEVETIKRWIST